MPFDAIIVKKGPRTHTNVVVGSGSATQLTTPSSNRKSVTFQNLGSVTVYLGKSDVAASSTTQGYALFAGASLCDTDSNDEWYGITASSTASVHVIEVN